MACPWGQPPRACPPQAPLCLSANSPFPSAAGATRGSSSSSDPEHPSHWVFVNERAIGNGSFGVVYQAQVKQTKKASCACTEVAAELCTCYACCYTITQLLPPQPLGSQEVAIKKVLQDKRFKNRELQIMKMLDHVNVTTLHHFFYTEGEKVRSAQMA